MRTIAAIALCLVVALPGCSPEKAALQADTKTNELIATFDISYEISGPNVRPDEMLFIDSRTLLTLSGTRGATGGDDAAEAEVWSSCSNAEGRCLIPPGWPPIAGFSNERLGVAKVIDPAVGGRKGR